MAGGNRRHPWVGLGLLACFAVALVAISVPAASAGEWALDIYVGPNFPSTDAGDGEATVGGRLGRWFTPIDYVDFGVFADSGAVLAEDHKVDLVAVPTTLLFLARVPLLRSPPFPEGRLQPYLGAGPSVVWSRVDHDVDHDDTTNAGADVRAGAAWMLWRLFGVFAEYRYTYFDPKYGDLDGRKVTFSNDLSIHHLLFGATFRF